jgi:hypothetical protein
LSAEALSMMCSSRRFMYALIVYTDLFQAWGRQLFKVRRCCSGQRHAAV